MVPVRGLAWTNTYRPEAGSEGISDLVVDPAAYSLDSSATGETTTVGIESNVNIHSSWTSLIILRNKYRL